MNKKKLRIYILLSLIGLLLTACEKDSRMQEMQAYVTQLKTMVINKNNNKVNPNYQLPKPVVYQGEAKTQLPEETTSKVSDGKSSPLQMYSLASLQFVGTISNQHLISAYILTPDNTIYQAKEGDAIGNNYGKITKIDVDHIEVLESTAKPGSNNKPSTRIVTMLLKD